MSSYLPELLEVGHRLSNVAGITRADVKNLYTLRGKTLTPDETDFVERMFSTYLHQEKDSCELLLDDLKRKIDNISNVANIGSGDKKKLKQCGHSGSCSERVDSCLYTVKDVSARSKSPFLRGRTVKDTMSTYRKDAKRLQEIERKLKTPRSQY